MYVVAVEIAVGLPLTVPVLGSKFNPEGKLGLTAKFNVPSPPVAVTGTKLEIVVFTVNKEIGTFTAVSSAAGALTVKLNVLKLVIPALSVTVTVNVVVVNVSVGVPLTAPLVTLKLKPAGNAGLIAKESGAAPPVAVTGVNAGSNLFLIRVLLASITVVTKGGLITINL